MVKIPIIFRVAYMLGGSGFFPSTVWAYGGFRKMVKHKNGETLHMFLLFFLCMFHGLQYIDEWKSHFSKWF